MLQLFTDTSANLPVALTKKHHITVIPFSYTVDGKAMDYPDDTDFDGAAFYGAMRELGNRFIRRVHRQHRNARIERVDVALRHELGDRTAAAGVGLSHLGHLPEDTVVVHQLSHLADNLGARVTLRRPAE